jgi:hypothetical protein
VAKPGYAPTEGCIALARAHLQRLLERLGSRPALAVVATKKAPEAFASGARSMACPDERRGPMERGPRRELSVVVGALAVIDEVETLALLVGAWPQAHQRLYDHEQDGRSDA